MQEKVTHIYVPWCVCAHERRRELSIDKQYRYEKKPFVFTYSEHKCRVSKKKIVAKIKFDRKIYPDLFMYVPL